MTVGDGFTGVVLLLNLGEGILISALDLKSERKGKIPERTIRINSKRQQPPPRKHQSLGLGFGSFLTFSSSFSSGIVPLPAYLKSLLFLLYPFFFLSQRGQIRKAKTLSRHKKDHLK